MTRKEFGNYLNSLSFSSFKPVSTTLHHTALPSLAMRPQGFSSAHLKNLYDYYGGNGPEQMGWHGAPHIFIDDIGEGIIVFQRMDRVGVHAKSFNSKYWGVEMLGNFDKESFTSGRGLKVRENTMHALALMCKRLGASPESLKFHRDDPLTSKTCPGVLVKKADVVNDVKKLLNIPVNNDEHVPAYSSPTIILPSGGVFKSTRTKDNRVIVPARSFLTSLGSIAGGIADLRKENHSIVWNKYTVDIAEFDENGNTWVNLRDVTNALKLNISIHGNMFIVTK